MLFCIVCRQKQNPSVVRVPRKSDLVFLELSPSYCERDEAIGSFGTHARTCNRTSRGYYNVFSFQVCWSSDNTYIRHYNLYTIHFKYYSLCRWRWLRVALLRPRLQHGASRVGDQVPLSLPLVLSRLVWYLRRANRDTHLQLIEKKRFKGSLQWSTREIQFSVVYTLVLKGKNSMNNLCSSLLLFSRACPSQPNVKF